MVVATAISGPASVYITLSASLAILLSCTFIIPKVSTLLILIFLRDANVSAVSPDCEMNIAKLFLSYRKVQTIEK